MTTDDPTVSTLDQLHRHPVLSAEDEAELVGRMLAGKQATQHAERTSDVRQRVALQVHIAAGEETRAELIRCNIRLVGSIARRFVGNSAIPYEDLVTFGIRGLMTLRVGAKRHHRHRPLRPGQGRQGLHLCNPLDQAGDRARDCRGGARDSPARACQRVSAAAQPRCQKPEHQLQPTSDPP